MEKGSDRSSVPRRDFLRLAGLGSVAGAAAAVSTAEQAEAAPTDTGKSAGYRETPHVKRYYELAKF